MFKRDIEFLLETGADVNVKDKKGNTPLMYAAQNNDVDLIERLVRAGAVIDAQNNEGNTAFIKAVGGAERKLLELGANPNIQNNSGATALLEAIHANFFAKAVYLIDLGVDVDIEANGTTALSVATTKKNEKLVKKLIDKVKDISLYTLTSFDDIALPEIHKRIQMKDIWESVLFYYIQKQSEYTQKDFTYYIRALLDRYPEMPTEIQIIFNTLM